MPKKQKSGLYRTKIKIGVDASGKDVVKWISGRTQKELEDAKREVIAKYIDGTALAADRLFGEYALKWYGAVKVPALSPSRQAAYRAYLNGHILPVFGDRNLRAITALDVQEFMNQFAGRSDNMINTLHDILRSIFAQACADRILDRNPAQYIRKPAAAPSNRKRAFTAAERERIENVCRTHEHGAFLGCLYYLGLRQGEARGLKWGDFDWEKGFVHIQRDSDFKDLSHEGELKTPAANRFIPIPSALRNILYPLRGMPTAYLFASARTHQPYTHWMYESIWSELMRACEMEGITAHYFRHNFITMCWEAGLDTFLTAKIVGHANPSTTASIYTHLTEDRLEKSKEEIEQVFKNKSCTKVAHED